MPIPDTITTTTKIATKNVSRKRFLNWICFGVSCFFCFFLLREVVWVRRLDGTSLYDEELACGDLVGFVDAACLRRLGAPEADEVFISYSSQLKLSFEPYPELGLFLLLLSAIIFSPIFFIKIVDKTWEYVYFDFGAVKSLNLSLKIIAYFNYILNCINLQHLFFKVLCKV